MCIRPITGPETENFDRITDSEPECDHQPALRLIVIICTFFMFVFRDLRSFVVLRERFRLFGRTIMMSDFERFLEPF